MNIANYLKELNRYHADGKDTEHSHRPALQTLLEAEISDIKAINEPKQIECGAPDFVLTRKSTPFGYVETKGLGKNLDSPKYTEQFNRYKKALGNLIITDYLEFRFYRDGELTDSVRIAHLIQKKIKPARAEFAKLKTLLQSFATYSGVTITTADQLARYMAIKAQLLARTIEAALQQDADANENAANANAANTTTNLAESNNDLTSQLITFRENLIHDIQAAAFADIYAQTIAYGMFAARLHDSSPATFTRHEAAQLIPANNPFLRKFFQHIVGYDLDPRIHWIVNDLADIFRAADVGELMKEYGVATQQTDPFLHFYETFLGAYNPALRKSRGVYYTPEPVVDFIVRAVDSLLKTEFKLTRGLADSSKTSVDCGKSKQQLHRVQILDPATGTGTFLAHVVRHIHQQFANQKGMWNEYVKNHLIPRLNGFEILMASYAVAHTKLQMEFKNSGCELGSDRLRIFLTNSLEEHHADKGGLFAQWLAIESREANFIKRDLPVMVVIGNPPYAVSSSNKGNYIQSLIADYKKNLNERKLNLDDDYIKFIRYGEHLVHKTGEGILAYISNNSFLDGATHRQMRKCLLETFDEIYIVDLHGNARKKETAPGGGKDQNVFDIMQGVSINLFIKTGKKNKGELAKVFHYDLYGTRESKYQFLWDNDLAQVRFQELNKIEPYYFFVPKDFSNRIAYEQGIQISKLFVEFGAGISTDRDKLFIDFDVNSVVTRIKKLLSGDFDDEFKNTYNVKDSSGYKMTKLIAEKIYKDTNIRSIQYRPFDYRWTYYDPAIISRANKKIMRHFLAGENISFIVKRGWSESMAAPCFISNQISERRAWSRPGMQGAESSCPLYLYPETEQKTIDGKAAREPNLNAEIVQKIAAELNLIFTREKETEPNPTTKTTFAPIDLLDYIYAVLHSRTYREKYKEFLKIDFPRVPYPTDANQFWQLVAIGGELRAVHLMHSDALNTPITAYPNAGDHRISKPHFEITDPVAKLGKVHINPTQFFANVPLAAWNFPIGGYQPAQKYLKDRKGRALNYDEIEHYQKIITALMETARLMQAVDEIL